MYIKRIWSWIWAENNGYCEDYHKYKIKICKGQSRKKSNIDKLKNNNKPKSDDNKVRIAVKWIKYLQVIYGEGSDHEWDCWWTLRGIRITVYMILEYFITTFYNIGTYFIVCFPLSVIFILQKITNEWLDIYTKSNISSVCVYIRPVKNGQLIVLENLRVLNQKHVKFKYKKK